MEAAYINGVIPPYVLKFGSPPFASRASTTSRPSSLRQAELNKVMSPANGLFISNSRVVIRRSTSPAGAIATKSGEIWAAAGHTTIQKRQIVAKTALFIKSSGFYLIISEHKKNPVMLSITRKRNDRLLSLRIRKQNRHETPFFDKQAPTSPAIHKSDMPKHNRPASF